MVIQMLGLGGLRALMRLAQAEEPSPDAPDPEFTDTLELDLSTVVPAIAGPKRPQDRINLDVAPETFKGIAANLAGEDKTESASTVTRKDGEVWRAIEDNWRRVYRG